MASPDIQDEIPLDAPGSIYASDQLSYNPPPQQRLDQGSGLQQTTLPAIPITRTITVEAVEVLPLNRSVTLMRPSLASSVPTTLERTNEHRTKEHGTNPLVASEESDVVEKTYHDSVSDNHGDQNSKSSNVEVAAASGISETEQDLAQLELHGSVDTTGHNAIRPAEVRADVRSKKFLEDVIPWELQGVVEQGSNRQQSSEPEELPEDQLYCIWRRECGY
ncbi:hypothetical protein BJ742DRAFT_13859 [Cladochytrium replicatum]|nr:hypothetical protein BJ742DRAFT_13859 [Cladochytrium replicatum]